MASQDFKIILNRLSFIEKKQDLQDQDRKLLEDISIQLSEIERRLTLVEENVRNSRKDLKEDIGNVGEQIVTSLDNVTTEVSQAKKVVFNLNWPKFLIKFLGRRWFKKWKI